MNNHVFAKVPNHVFDALHGKETVHFSIYTGFVTSG